MIAKRLRQLAAEVAAPGTAGGLRNPNTWLAVAERLGIGVFQFCRAFAHQGRLIFAHNRNRWVIELNTVMGRWRQCRILIHELAHWFLKTATPAWLCDEQEVVYYVTGSIPDARHDIARRVERLVLR